MTDNDVPTQLATIGRTLGRAGWVRTGGTWTHPLWDGWRLNTAYAHREATVSVSTLDTQARVRKIKAYYRGEHPLRWANSALPLINKKFFADFADNRSDNE